MGWFANGGGRGGGIGRGYCRRDLDQSEVWRPGATSEIAQHPNVKREEGEKEMDLQSEGGECGSGKSISQSRVWRLGRRGLKGAGEGNDTQLGSPVGCRREKG